MNPLRTPDQFLLLYSDPSEPVSRVLLDQPGRFPRPVLAIPLDRLVDAVETGPVWRWNGRAIDPARTAVIHRLARPPSFSPDHPLATYAAERRFWTHLSRELRRFAYASSLPTATSMIGCHGSLVDQWLDVPALVPELVPPLRVPAHRGGGSQATLAGDVHAIDPWHLYSFGSACAPTATVPPGRVLYERPRGQVVHVAQVGTLLLSGPPPPAMTPADQSYIVSFAQAMAGRTATRILEHAFVVGDGPPVFYSTCPFPVITGSLPAFAELVVRGLVDDVARRRLDDPASTRLR